MKIVRSIFYSRHMIPNKLIASTPETARASVPLLALVFGPPPVRMACPALVPEGTGVTFVARVVDVAEAVYKLTSVLLPNTSEPPVLVPRSMVSVEVQIVA